MACSLYFPHSDNSTARGLLARKPESLVFPCVNQSFLVVIRSIPNVYGLNPMKEVRTPRRSNPNRTVFRGRVPVNKCFGPLTSLHSRGVGHT